MITVRLGRNNQTGKPVGIPSDSFTTHYHLIGGTGKGKTTAIQTILQQLLIDPFEVDCHILFDRLGGMSHDLLLWMASDFCTPEVRDRLVYIEPSNEDYVLGFNPLLYSTDGEGYYKVQRATEIVLRAWESTNIEAMPRLRAGRSTPSGPLRSCGSPSPTASTSCYPAARTSTRSWRSFRRDSSSSGPSSSRRAVRKWSASSSRPVTASSPTSRATSCGACSA